MVRTTLASRVCIAAVLTLSAMLAGCSTPDEAPADTGVCWHMGSDVKGGVGGRVVGAHRFHQVAANVPDLEHCAAALEAMRLRFLNMGGSERQIVGSYQGQFLFIDPRGVFSATSLQTTPFPMLVRTGDGRLVPPGAAGNP